MKRKLICSVVIFVVVLSLGVVAPPSFVKAQPIPDYQIIIQDPDEALDDGLDLKDICAAVDETSLYIKGVTYGDWSSIFKFWVIFLDVDQDPNTGGNDTVCKPPNYPEGVHGIGADYAAWVGDAWQYVSPWAGDKWDHNSVINYSSYDMDDENHTFEIVISLSDIGNPTAIDIVGYTENFAGPYDYAPDDGFVTYPSPVIEITIDIDIKPGSEPNSINLGSKGVVPVAILTTDEPEFDATTVDPETVKFADAAPKRWTSEDVDEDGDIDLLFHFKIQELNLTESSEDATLTGETSDGDKITGTDSVRIVPAKGQK